MRFFPSGHYPNSLRATRVPVILCWLALAGLLLTSLFETAAFAQSGGRQLPRASSLTIESDRPRIGLVLSGGGARGFAHISVLKMLDSLEVPVDYITGTSMGGIIGALYALGYSGDSIETLVKETDWRALFDDTPPRIHLPFFTKQTTGRYQFEFGMDGYRPRAPSGMVFGQNLSMLFSDLSFPQNGQIDFDRLPIPFRCVAIDLITGNQVVLRSGSLAKAMCATMAIPSIFSPIAWGDSLLADGGGANNLPVDVVREMGADFVIAVDVGVPNMKPEQLRSALSVLQRWLALGGHDRWRKNVDQTDVMIQLNLGDFSVGSFNKKDIQEILSRGSLAARQNTIHLAALASRWKQDRWQNDQRRRSSSAMRNMDPELVVPIDLLPRIGDVRVDGNELYSRRFIRKVLGIPIGTPVDKQTINRGINNLYSLGHFEIIRYEIEPMEANEVRLILSVKELPPGRLRLGIHYDNYHQLVPVVGLQSINALLPGTRLQGELQFAGLTRLTLRADYPSLALNLPIYPFIDLMYKDVDVNLYDNQNTNFSQYRDRSITSGAGIGLLFSKSLNAEFGYQFEHIDTEQNIVCTPDSSSSSWQEDLYQIVTSVEYDRLDDAHFPKRGGRFSIEMENSPLMLNSKRDYRKFSAGAESYFTFNEHHTIHLGLWRCDGTATLPSYKHHRVGGPTSFVGICFDQLQARRITIGRIDYRRSLSNGIDILLKGNIAWDYLFAEGNGPIASDYIWGAGIGVKIHTAAGPLEAIWSCGRAEPNSDRPQLVGYFTFGSIL